MSNTAIICLTSELTHNNGIVKEFRKRIKGDVLKIIGSSSKHTDLKKYDRLFVMYQNSLPDISDVFMRFCEEYKDDLNRATLVVTYPVYEFKNSVAMEQSANDIRSFYKDYWCGTMGCKDGDTMVFATSNGNKSLVVPFATRMGCKWDYLNGYGYDPQSCSLMVCPYIFVIEETEKTTNSNAKIKIVLGVLLIFVGIFGASIGIYYGVTGGGRIATISFFGAIMIYFGRKNLINNRWTAGKNIERVKNKEIAVILSFIPGLGHIYMGEKRNGVILLAITIATGVLIIISLFMNWFNSVELVVYLLLFAPAHLFFSFFNVEDICNRSNVFGETISLYGCWVVIDPRNIALYKAEVVVFFGSLILFVSVAAAVMISEHTIMNVLVALLSMVFIIYYSATYKRNLRPKTFVFDFISQTLSVRQRAIIFHGKMFPSMAVRRLSHRFSAEVVNISKLSNNEAVDLSGYGLVLIEHYPHLHVNGSKMYERFLDVNSHQLYRFTYLIPVELFASYSKCTIELAIDSTRDLLNDLQIRVDRKLRPYLIPTSDYITDQETIKTASVQLDMPITSPIHEPVNDWKGVVLMTFYNVNRYLLTCVLIFILAVALITGLVADIGNWQVGILIVSSIALTFTIIFTVELLTKRSKHLLYKYLIDENGTFGGLAHRKAWGIGCMMLSIILASICASFFL